MRRFAVMALAAAAVALATPVAAAAGQPQGAASGSMLSLSEITLILFTLTNSFRVVAFLPQIWKAATIDEHGVRGISCLTWVLFLVCNLTTAIYAMVNLQDWAMAAIFLGSTTGSAAIVGISTWRRIARRPPPCTSLRR